MLHIDFLVNAWLLIGIPIIGCAIFIVYRQARAATRRQEVLRCMDIANLEQKLVRVALAQGWKRDIREQQSSMVVGISETDSKPDLIRDVRAQNDAMQKSSTCRILAENIPKPKRVQAKQTVESTKIRLSFTTMEALV